MTTNMGFEGGRGQPYLNVKVRGDEAVSVRGAALGLNINRRQRRRIVDNAIVIQVGVGVWRRGLREVARGDNLGRWRQVINVDGAWPRTRRRRRLAFN